MFLSTTVPAVSWNHTSCLWFFVRQQLSDSDSQRLEIVCQKCLNLQQKLSCDRELKSTLESIWCLEDSKQSILHSPWKIVCQVKKRTLWLEVPLRLGNAEWWKAWPSILEVILIKAVNSRYQLSVMPLEGAYLWITLVLIAAMLRQNLLQNCYQTIFERFYEDNWFLSIWLMIVF